MELETPSQDLTIVVPRMHTFLTQQGDVFCDESVDFVVDVKKDEVIRAGDAWRVRVNAAYTDMLPADHFADYSDYVRLDGEILKDEPRTRITLVTGMPLNGNGSTSDCVLKEYWYTRVSGIRTWIPRSKAGQEFDALNVCRDMDVPAVEPIACGARRSWNGMVQTCFLLTRYEEGYVSWREWRRNGCATDMAQPLADMASELGTAIRRLHAVRFFLMGPVGKNTIVRHDGGDRIDWRLLDMPYARFLGPLVPVRWGQQEDLGLVASALENSGGDELVEKFVSAYLPDPFGKSEDGLRARVLRGMKAYRNETSLAWFSHNLKRALKRLRKRFND